MTRTNKKGHGAIEVADPDLGGAGIKVESLLFVDLGRRIGRGEDPTPKMKERSSKGIRASPPLNGCQVRRSERSRDPFQ
jgi:hypothetical protein